MSEPSTRRQFLELAAAVGTTTALGAATAPGEEVSRAVDRQENQFKPLDEVCIGLVGIGSRGSSLLPLLLDLEGVKIQAIGDLVESRVDWAQNQVGAAGQRRPTGYTRGEYDFQRMCNEEDLDLVMVVTPWRWHVPMCVAAMEAGKTKISMKKSKTGLSSGLAAPSNPSKCMSERLTRIKFY